MAQGPSIPFFPQRMRDEIRARTYQDFLRADAVKRDEDYKPRLVNWRDLNLISHDTHLMATETSTFLRRRAYKMEWHWILHDEHHVYTRSEGRAFRKQWNIGLSITEDPSRDYLRVGLGFILKAKDHRGWDDWADFYVLVQANQPAFDQLFAAHLGGLGYAEPDTLMPITAQRLLQHVPNTDDDWVFVGQRLSWANEADLQILNDHPQFIDTCDKVFKRIRAAGYARGL
jgi:hypothetical protein